MNISYSFILKKQNSPIKKWSEDLNKHFSSEDRQQKKQKTKKQNEPNKQTKKTHTKRVSKTSQIIREMQIRTTMKYYLTQFRMAIIKKSTNNKCWRGCGQKGTLLHCWWEYKLVQPLWSMWRFLKELNVESLYALGIPLLGYIWRKP